MPSAPDLRQQQRQFTAWLRHPGTTTAPAGIEPRRLEIYRDLLRNNVTSFVDITFPVAGAVLPATLWARLKEGFFADFRCTSPLFNDISLHFREYVDSLDWPEITTRPWLRELLHYEWMELVADTDDSPVPAPADIADADSLFGADAPADPPLRLATPAWPLAYQWRVQDWHAGTDPATEAPTPCCLLVFRGQDAQLSLRQLEVTPMAAFLAELLQAAEDRPATPGTLAARLRLASPALPEARALDMTRSVLHDLARHGLPFLRPGR